MDLTIRESLDERNHPHDYTAKRDIWNSAILFVELLFGSQANWTYRGLPYLRESESQMRVGTELINRSFNFPISRFSLEINLDRSS